MTRFVTLLPGVFLREVIPFNGVAFASGYGVSLESCVTIEPAGHPAHEIKILEIRLFIPPPAGAFDLPLLALSGFVSCQGTNFMLNGKPYFFAGANCYDFSHTAMAVPQAALTPSKAVT